MWGISVSARTRTCGILAAFILMSCSAEQDPPAPPGPRVYVTNENSGDLTLIDAGSRRVIGRVPLGKRPRGIVASPDGRLLYIALSGSPMGGPGVDESTLPPADKAADGIAIFDVASGRVLRVLRGVSDPETVAVSPDGGRLYVASEDTGLVVAMDAQTGRVLGQVEIGGEPEGGAVSPDGRLVVATSEEDSTAAVIDAASLQLLRRVPVGERPRNVMFAGDRAIIPGENDGSVVAIDPAAGRVLARVVIPGETVRPMGLAATTAAIFVTTGRGGELVRLNADDLQVTGRVGVGERPWGVAATPDGRFLFTANGPSNDVAMVDSATMQVVARFPAGDRPWGVAVLPP
jgi:YVTN family beta-propeller protein